jgi:hypothetical protein
VIGTGGTTSSCTSCRDEVDCAAESDRRAVPSVGEVDGGAGPHLLACLDTLQCCRWWRWGEVYTVQEPGGCLPIDGDSFRLNEVWAVTRPAPLDSDERLVAAVEVGATPNCSGWSHSYRMAVSNAAPRATMSKTRPSALMSFMTLTSWSRSH